MRAYLAIITDCFHEALASRVLWMLLALITLLLLILLPLGYGEKMTEGVDDNTVSDWPRFALHLRKESITNPKSPANHILGILDPQVRNRLLEFELPTEGDPEVLEWMTFFPRLQQALTKSMQSDDFYRKEVWDANPMLTDEGRKLAELEPGEITSQQIRRRNRLAFEAAFPQFVTASPPVTLYLKYGTASTWPIPLPADQFRSELLSWFLFGLRWGVGPIGVVIAILVTASMIPQIFDPGSLNLLLSKPISRSLMFLSKYLGGCMFILINASYLITGLWCILGLRFGIWENKILLAIPIYVFIFAIYYAVSALVGVVWRSPIMAIIVGILFWMLCFGVEFTHSLCKYWGFDKWGITQILDADGTILTVNELGFTNAWDDEQRTWKQVFESDRQRSPELLFPLMILPVNRLLPELRPAGPIYDARRDRLLSIHYATATESAVVNVGRRDDNWESQTGAAPPASTLKLLQDSQGKLTVIARTGIYRVQGDPGTQRKPVAIFGFDIPLSAGSPFQSADPTPPVILTPPADAAINQSTDHLVTFSRSELNVLRLEGKRYQHVKQRKLDIDLKTGVALGAGGDTILLASADGRLRVLSASTLEERHERRLEGNNAPRFITSSPSGRWFSIVFQNGALWLYDAQQQNFVKPRINGQGTISAATMPDDDALLVADHLTRVTHYDLNDFRIIKRWQPSQTVASRLFYYGLVPVYTVCPKPGRLDLVTNYFITGKETSGTTLSIGDLSMAQAELNPWQPIWSSLGFTAVLLLISCIYIERQEF